MGKSNQKTVKTNKEKCDRNNYYATINLDALQFAVASLSGDGFKMWVYFSKNQNGWVQQLSSKHAQETFNLSKRRYDNAIKELIEGGFLVDANTNPDDVVNSWEFYEKPLVEEMDKPLQTNNTSLFALENKPSLTDDTRNITQNTITKNIVDEKTTLKEEISFTEMTDKQRREFFVKKVF